MNCREVLDLLDDCADPAARARMSWRLRVHLWICRQCRRYLSTYRATIRLEKAAFREGPEQSPPISPELKAAILAARPKP